MLGLSDKWQLTRETVGDGRLSVVMPLYRLAAEAEANLRRVADIFERHSVNAELIPVDDGSGDGTDLVLRPFIEAAPPAWATAYAHVVIRPVICRVNGGKGAALRAGFEASTGEYVMLLDGDLDINPLQTPAFFEALVSQKADIVVGSKRHPKSTVQYPWHRRLVSACYFLLVKWLAGLRITDTQTGMKLFRREALGPALDRMLVKTYAFDLELLAIAASRGARIAEAPVVIRFGSKFGALRARTVYNMAMDTLAVFYRLRLLRYYAHCLVPRRLDHDPLVTVVIACPGRSWMLDECLNAMGQQTYRNFEVIVLPDEEFRTEDRRQTTDGAVPHSPFPISLSILPTGKVRPAEKRNIGIREAKGEIVAFIDDDAYPDPHWLEYAVKYFVDDDIGGVGGPGITPPGDGYMAKLGGRVYDNALVSGNYRYRYKAGGVRRDVDDYPSCNLFVRTSLLRRINGYRTDFWPGEDTLLCKDIVDSGHRIVYDPWVVVHHHRRALFGPHLRQLGRYAFHRGYFVRRFPSNSAHFSYFVPSLFVLYLVAAAVLAAVPEPDYMPTWLFCAWHGFIAVPSLLYFSLVLLTTFAVNPITWLLTALGVFATHVVYGVRFVQGLCARRAPCEYIGKDHPND